MGTAFKFLPRNYLADWGEFESWASGASSAPDGWIKATAPGVAQETSSIKFGAYSARVIGSTGGIGGIYRTIPDGNNYAGRTFKLGVWAKSASTGPYIEINDGVSSQTVHVDGTNAFVFLTTPSMKLDYAATQIRINLMASTNATAYFDSAVLCEGEDLFTDMTNNIAISSWAPTLNMKNDQYEISQREGSFIPDVHLQGKNLKLSGSVVGSDVTSTRTHFDNLLKSLLSWKTQEKSHLYLYDDRVTDVFLKGVDWNYVNGLQMIKFNVQLSAPDPTTRFINKYRNRKVISGTVTEFNLTYNGSAESRPVISFVADQSAVITTCQLENLTTQENVIYSGTVPLNAALDIDCDAGTIFNSGINRISDFGTSDFIRLVRGTNYFRFSGSACTINIDWYDKYL